jgi:cholest-4-en-3-one 26-monooxygenase
VPLDIARGKQLATTRHQDGVPQIDTGQIDLLDLDRFAASGAPHEWFTYLRRHAPIAHHPEPDGPGFYVFSRHEDVVAIGRDPGHFSSDPSRGAIVGLEEPAPEHAEMMKLAESGQSMITMDPPAHSRYRRLVNRGFTPKMIGALDEKIAELSAVIVSDLLDKGDVDFVVDVAAQLPLIVIAELVGIPEEDRSMVFHWTNQFLGQDDPEYNSSIEDVTKAVVAFYDYAQELADRARSSPKDDIISKLLSADVDGDRLSDMDFNRFFELLVLAGNETTRTAITHGMMAFIDHPEQYERLAADPSLIATAADEILRWSSPTMYFRRNVTQDHEYKGVQLRAGDKVSIWYVSANRDEDVFADPFTFDIARNPNPHIAFGGGGPHHCLGAHLARTEIRSLFSELVKRVRAVESVGSRRFLRSNFLHGVKHLPVRVRAR